MSSTTTAGQDAGGGGSSLGRRILLWLGVVLLAVLALLGGLAAAMGTDALLALLSGNDPVEAVESVEADSSDSHGGHSDTDGAAGAGSHGMEMLTFDEMIVNITSVTLQGRQTSRFLKTNLALVYDPEAEGADRIASRQVYMRDGFQDYMRQLTEMDLKGSIGLVELKSELLRRARAITGSTAPREILVADLIVQ